MNHTPRKSLGWRIPADVFQELCCNSGLNLGGMHLTQLIIYVIIFFVETNRGDLYLEHTTINTRIETWLFTLREGKPVPMGSLDSFNSMVAKNQTSFPKLGMTRPEVYDLWFENHKHRAEETFKLLLVTEPPNDDLKAKLDQILKVYETRYDWRSFTESTDQLRALLTDMESISFDSANHLLDANKMIYRVMQGAENYQISFTEMDIKITVLRQFIRMMLSAARLQKRHIEESDDGDEESDEYSICKHIAEKTFSQFESKLSCIAR